MRFRTSTTVFLIACCCMLAPSVAAAQDPGGGQAFGEPNPALVPAVVGAKAKMLPNGLAAAPQDAPPAVQQAIWSANEIIGLPYRYGGGHGSFTDSGYDCSGSVSYVLHGAGLLHVSLDSSQFMSWGAAGPGRWITVYANPGHAYLTIRTRHGLLRYDTSGMDDGSRWDGTPRPSGGYSVRHPVGY